MNKPENSIWTDEQWDAIVTTGSNIIVSAGAGSGKTAVLTERVIYKLKQGIDINSLIVLTFTNAAAKEMKERIRSSIKKDENLKDQLALIDSANITTFDAYSLYLVKKYHYLLNLKKDINVIDNIYLKINKKRILDDLFMEFYDDPEFINFIDKFTNKDDEPIKKLIDEINNKVSNIYDKKSLYSYTLNIDEVINDYMNLLKENHNIILNLLDEIINNIKDERIIDYVINIKSALNIQLTNYSDFLKIKNYKFPSFPKNKDIDELDSEYAKKYMSKVKEFYNEIVNLTNYENIDDVANELLKANQNTKLILKIINEYNDRIFQFKLKNNSFEFNDILFLSIKLLLENEKVLNEIKYNTNEIMVDEFQDTNDNNEYFLSLISNNNLYMVGDVKQSIYKFRNANSKIFTNTYYKYKNGLGIAIDLNKNFRSRKEVLESINLIFERIMDSYIGGVDYDESQKLNFGNTSYLENNQNNYLEILNYEYENYKKDYSKDEVEIFLIANDIKSKIENKYQIFDIKKKKFRNIAYSDFVILIDRKSNFELYKKIFEYENIPLIMHNDESFSYNSTLLILNNIFRLINYFYKKDLKNINYEIVSILRSYLYEYQDEVILENIDKLDCDEFKDLFDKINYLADFYKDHTLKDLIYEIYNIFDFYMQSIKIKDVYENNIKLDYFIMVVTNLEKIGYTLDDLVNYFEEMFENNLDISFSINNDSKPAVNIMTIHKSKGLEFPVCYFPSLYKEFNVRDVYDLILFDTKYNIVSPIFNKGIKDTILKPLVKKNYLKEDIEEKIRLFYVALTRAKEKIIFVTDLMSKEDLSLPCNNIVNNLERLNYKSFNDILLSIKKHLIPYIKNKDVVVSKNYESIKDNNFELQINKVEKKYFYKEINILPYEDNNNFSTTYDTNNNELLESGILLHQILEYLEFDDYKNDINNYALNDYFKEKIVNFFEMPFMKEWINIYKEYEFIYEDKIGIIDLLIEKTDKFIVVDYKTKNINKESYINQVKKYVNYINKISSKPTEGYIYSIIDSEYIKVDEL